MGADRLSLLRKILTRLRGTNFCTSSARFAPSKATKQSQMHPNRTKHTKTRVQSPIRRIGCVRCVKFLRDLVAQTFAPVGPFCTEFLRSNQTVPNAPNQYKTHQNMSSGSNGVDRVRSLRKIPTRLRGTNFCTSLTRFAQSIGRQSNSPKCTQIVQKARKEEFRVQWGGSGAFIVKNSNANLWHELLHQFDPFCIECCMATKESQMHPNSSKCTKMCVQGPMGRIGCFHCEKLRCDFVA